MTEKPKKKKKDIYSVLLLLAGIALIAAGIIGIISSRQDKLPCRRDGKEFLCDLLKSGFAFACKRRSCYE